MFEVGLRSGPDVRWAVWREAEKIPETAQHVPHARTPPKAVNKEARQNGPGSVVEAVVPTACQSTGPWHKGLYNSVERLARDSGGDHFGNSFCSRKPAMHLFKNTIVAAHKLRVQAANLRRCLRSDLFQHIIDPVAESCRPSGLTGFVKSRLARSNAPAGNDAERGRRRDHRFSFPMPPTKD